jgi:hypothetical protein
VDEPEVFFELADGVFGDPAAEAVMGLDLGRRGVGLVGDDGVEPPPVEIVQGELRRWCVGGARSAAADAGP